MKIGLDAALYIGGTEATNTRDLTLNLEMTMAEATRRLMRTRQNVPTLLGISIEFDYLCVAGDSMFTSLQAAFFNRTKLQVSCEDAGVAYGGGAGIRGVFHVSQFNRNEPLEEGITYSVVLVPAFDAQEPYWN